MILYKENEDANDNDVKILRKKLVGGPKNKFFNCFFLFIFFKHLFLQIFDMRQKFL